MPVYRLLGGTGDIATVTVPAILSIGPPDEMVANAKEAVDNGYDQIKIKVGDDTETDIERIQQVVTTVPEDVSVKVDVNQAWGDAATALSVINRIPDKVAALEQPVAPENVDDLALLRERSIIPIMPDESFETAANVVNLIKRGAGDIYNMKLMKTGGISGAIQLNAVAEADHRPTQLGSMVEGHVGTAAGIHIVHALDNVVWNELVGPFKTTDSIGDLETDQPEIRVKGPGLGVDINRDDLKRLRTDRITID